MAVTPTTFKARFPEFVSADDARVQIFIDDALLEVSEEIWGDLYDKGVAYLTAHLLTVGEKTSSGSSGSLNALASKSVEGVSVSYAAAAGNANNNFQATSYGQEYWRLFKLLGRGAVFSV